MPSGMVYLIQAGDLYKIGRTRNLLFRIQTIHSQLHMPIRILKLWVIKYPNEIENLFHHMMSQHKIYGEWFRLDYAAVERLRSIRFDLQEISTSLPSFPPLPTNNNHSEHPKIARGMTPSPPQRLLRCQRCGLRWTERVTGPPRRCPSCKSVRWNTREPYSHASPRKRRRATD